MVLRGRHGGASVFNNTAVVNNSVVFFDSRFQAVTDLQVGVRIQLVVQVVPVIQEDAVVAARFHVWRSSTLVEVVSQTCSSVAAVSIARVIPATGHPLVVNPLTIGASSIRTYIRVEPWTVNTVVMAQHFAFAVFHQQ